MPSKLTVIDSGLIVASSLSYLSPVTLCPDGTELAALPLQADIKGSKSLRIISAEELTAPPFRSHSERGLDWGAKSTGGEVLYLPGKSL
jgi:hypothetical protein